MCRGAQGSDLVLPLGKVSKFIENGREDSVLVFTKVVVARIDGANQGASGI